MGFVWLKRVRWMAGPVALLAGLTAHGVVALIVFGVLFVVLAVLGRGMLRWIISSDDHSDRLIRLILASRGDGRSLAQAIPRSLASSPGHTNGRDDATSPQIAATKREQTNLAMERLTAPCANRRPSDG
jgi:hypothetical protein